MKKFLILLALLPCVSFGAFDYNYGDLVLNVQRVRLFRWTSFGVTPAASNQPFLNPVDLDQLYSFYTSSIFGFSCVTSRNTIAVSSPSPTAILAPGSTLSQTITNSVYCVTNGNKGVAVSLFAFPQFSGLFTSLAALYMNGYRGPGFPQVFVSGQNSCINVDYPALVSDILCSTNSVYRQILLSHLNFIQDALVSIDSGVSALSPVLSDIRYINSSISSNSLSSSSSLRSIDQDMDTLIDRVGDVLDKVSSDPFVNDFTNAVNALLSSGKISNDQAISFLSGYSSLSTPTAKAVFALSLKENINASQFAKDFISTAATSDLSDELVVIGQSLGADVVDALIGDYSDSPSRGGKAVNNRTSIKAQLQSWRQEAKQQLQDWKDDLKRDLQAWKTSDETGILNVRSDINNAASAVGANGSLINLLFDPGNIDNNPHALNYVVSGITNSNSRDLSNLSRSITNAINDLKSSLFSGENHLDVRIKYPLRYQSTDEVNVHDAEVVDAIRNGYININELKSAILEALQTADPSVRIKGTNYVDLSEWLDEWRRWVDDSTFYDLALSFEDFKTNALPLFSDYRSAFKVPSNFYKNAFDIVRNSSHSNILDRLCFYGLSREPEEGNFFELYTSSALLHSELVSAFLDVKDLVDDLSSSSSWFDGLSPFSVARKVSDSIPSKTQIEQIVSTSTEGTNLVSSSSTDMLNSFSLMTNLHSSAFYSFTSSSSSTLPDSIVLFRLRTKSLNSASSYRDVRIPVGSIPNVWLLVRLSVAFGICVVNLILFPKFLLKLALLFMPLFKKSLPFLNAVT